jgi:hypothetical protein
MHIARLFVVDVYKHVYPPSIVISAPVIYLLASEPRRMTAPLRSEGSAIRPFLSVEFIWGLTIGIRFNHSSLNLVLASRMTFVRLVNVYPGLY